MFGSQEWVQCQECGEIHIINTTNLKTEDDLYVKIKCKKCREITLHLLCGDRIEDLYKYYNANVDPRYY